MRYKNLRTDGRARERLREIREKNVVRGKTSRTGKQQKRYYRRKRSEKVKEQSAESTDSSWKQEQNTDYHEESEYTMSEPEPENESRYADRLKQKSERANARLDKKQKQNTYRKKLKKNRVYDEAEGKAHTKIRFDDISVTESSGKSLQKKAVKYALHSTGAVAGKGKAKIHNEVYKAEDDNLGVKAAHRTELTGEAVLRYVYDEVKEHKSTVKQKSVRNAEIKAEKANTRMLYEKSLSENPTLHKSISARAIQKREIKKRYAAAYRATGNGTAAAETVNTAVAPAARVAVRLHVKAGDFVRKNPGAVASLIAAVMFVIMIIVCMGTVGTMAAEAGNSVVETTYLSSDEDILAADEKYSSLETALQQQINDIETTYSGYDEYIYQIDEITHNPYSLTSYLTSMYGNFKFSDIKDNISELFNQQYTLTLTTGGSSEHRILYVTLTNKGIDAIASEELTDNQLSLYRIYQTTSGNRTYLFGEVIDNISGTDGTSYQIPSEALSDERFAAMIKEAEKYLGMAYVWGGSSPSTGFDCSGFVSWVLNHSGWNIGRQTARSLLSMCTYVSPEEAQPGDLIFFQKTYNVEGASHVGIYVGNNMMIHCGNPIKYASINSSYWQQHFLAFGRLPTD